ncbi:hypothetical protein [Polaribacter sp. Hel_I_88]|uniref:hypothetical protein n=1 Tax=Polaribacter sp. Hel_I_88 TaxID=1250006 RepID=UPI0012DE57DB|nr:hypothetical protein [Polaribacter sp. Hel_I_88]
MSRNDKASFGFIGARSINSKKDRVLKTKIIESENEDGTIINSQRFRIYRKYTKRYFSLNHFSHLEMRSISCYLLLNKKNNLTPDESLNFFLKYINDDF